MTTPISAQSIAPVCINLVTAAIISATLLGCSGSTPPSAEASGGASSMGGFGGLGGTLTTSGGGSTLASSGGVSSAITTGGTSAVAGTTGGNSSTASSAVGGASTSGGASATGGASSSAIASGGSPSTGGMPNTGGAKSSGGTQSIGGSATGGTSAVKTSGGTSTGGLATGGVNTGGTQAVGGSNATGGASSTAGGSVSTGGSSSSGASPITIWMAGDSTMMNCSSACPCGWGSQFGSYFNASVTVQNRAVGGRSIQTWLYEKAVTDTMGSDKECVLSSDTYDTRWTTLLTSMKAGDYMMIAFGINDGDTACPRHVGSTRFKTLLDTMVKAVQAKGGVPVLLTPTDAIECSGSTVIQKRGFLTETKAVATADNVPLIDLNQLSMDLYKQLGFCPNSGDYTSTTSDLGKFFCDDHTHFEAAGAKQIAGLVANAIKTQGIGLAVYLK